MLAAFSGKEGQEEFWGSSAFGTHWLPGVYPEVWGVQREAESKGDSQRHKINGVCSMLPQLVCLFSIMIYLKGVYSTAD